MNRNRAQSYAVNLRYPDAARCGVTSPSASRKRILEMVTSGKSGRSRSRTAPIDIPASAGLSGAVTSLHGHAGVVVRLGPVRNTSRNLPICTSSPLASTAESTGSRLT